MASPVPDMREGVVAVADLSPAMFAELNRLAMMTLPASYVKHNFPGFPAGNIDMRCVSALQKRGLVECVSHQWRPHGGTDIQTILTYRATDAGRALIHA